MKKAVKSLIIAASVAAIAGIGAVSFAAWTGGTKEKTGITTGGTSHVDTTGFGTGSTSSLTDKLMPWNQSNPAASTGETTIYHIKLVVEGNAASSYKIQGKYTAQKDSSNYTWNTDGTTSKLVYKIDQVATTAYSGSDWATWTPNGEYGDLTGGDTLTAGDWYVHVALESEAAADMDVTLTFAFKLETKGN